MVGKCVYFSGNGENVYVTAGSGDPVYYDRHLTCKPVNIVNPENIAAELQEEYNLHGRY